MSQSKIQIRARNYSDAPSPSCGEFSVWQGKDILHIDLDVVIRLRPDGSIFLSTREGPVSTIRSCVVSLETLQSALRELTVNRSYSVCPTCGRKEAKSLGDVISGMCPDKWAPNDPDAQKDCERFAAEPK